MILFQVTLTVLGIYLAFKLEDIHNDLKSIKSKKS